MDTQQVWIIISNQSQVKVEVLDDLNTIQVSLYYGSFRSILSKVGKTFCAEYAEWWLKHQEVWITTNKCVNYKNHSHPHD